ncbi:hypothetical protein [Paenibacillus jiagnxiensis]|uniref:hypothetical protein n=1 Tax=Paenibacillus jiagnxiensis TaxID=3228926 RepID=UPI0033BC146C
MGKTPVQEGNTITKMENKNTRSNSAISTGVVQLVIQLFPLKRSPGNDLPGDP